MKKTTLIISFLCFSLFSIYAQFDIILLTDTSSYNTDPVMLNYNNNELLLIYEKQFQGDTVKKIYFKNMDDLETEYELAGLDGCQFRNPNIGSYGYSGDVVFYESNINGNYEIYYKYYEGNGVFSEEKQLSNVGKDVNNSHFAQTYNKSIVCWESDSSIYLAIFIVNSDTIYFTTVTLIDSVNSVDPVVTENGIYWRKIVGKESHIYKSDYIWNKNQINNEVVMDNGNYVHLSSFNSFLSSGTPHWSNYVNMYFYTDYLDSVNYELVDTAYYPSFFYHPPFVKEINAGYHGFSAGLIGERNIYFGEHDYFYGQVTFTNTDDIKLKMLKGLMHNNEADLWSVWEAHAENHVGLYGFKIALSMSKVQNISKNQFEMEASPNPFQNMVNIRFYNHRQSPAIIKVFDTKGRLLEELNNIQTDGEYSTTVWIPKNKYENGVYFIHITYDNMLAVQKVVYNN